MNKQTSDDNGEARRKRCEFYLLVLFNIRHVTIFARILLQRSGRKNPNYNFITIRIRKCTRTYKQPTILGNKFRHSHRKCTIQAARSHTHAFVRTHYFNISSRLGLFSSSFLVSVGFQTNQTLITD